jgi:hypothetical protein
MNEAAAVYSESHHDLTIFGSPKPMEFVGTAFADGWLELGFGWRLLYQNLMNSHSVPTATVIIIAGMPILKNSR